MVRCLLVAAALLGIVGCTGREKRPEFGENDLAGALWDVPSFDAASVTCIRETRQNLGFERTVEAAFECSEMGDRRAALIDFIRAARITGALERSELPGDFDIDEFVTCLSDTLEGMPGSEIDQIWEAATSMESLGEQAALASAETCAGDIVGQLVGDVVLTGEEIVSAVLVAIDVDPASIDPIEIEENGVLITYIGEPVELAAVANAADELVISIELVTANPATSNDVSAADTVLRLFGFDVEASTLLAEASPESGLSAGGYLACVESMSEEISLRVVPAALSCERA